MEQNKNKWKPVPVGWLAQVKVKDLEPNQALRIACLVCSHVALVRPQQLKGCRPLDSITSLTFRCSQCGNAIENSVDVVQRL